MGFESLENLSVVRLAVIGLIRQGQPTLFDEHDVALGITGVIVDKETPETLNASALDVTEDPDQSLVPAGKRCLNTGDHGLEGAKANLFDAVFVHKTFVKLAHLLGF
jgi:hypothetical protein